jgi:hypothetical protein
MNLDPVCAANSQRCAIVGKQYDSKLMPSTVRIGVRVNIGLCECYATIRMLLLWVNKNKHEEELEETNVRIARKRTKHGSR